MSEHTEKLMADLKTVVGDTEELLKATAGEAGVVAKPWSVWPYSPPSMPRRAGDTPASAAMAARASPTVHGDAPPASETTSNCKLKLLPIATEFSPLTPEAASTRSMV